MKEVIRILLADDHAVVREGLRALLDQHHDFQVVAEVGDGDAALVAIRVSARRAAGCEKP